MTERAVEETFAALFALTDLRQIFRETKPTYELNNEQKKRVGKIVDRVRQSLKIIEKEIAQ